MDANCQILPITSEDEAKVISFLNANFIKHEPMNVSLGASLEFKAPFEMIEGDLSLKMETESGELLGIAINALGDDVPQHPDEENNEIVNDESHGPEFMPILKFLNYLDELTPVKNKEAMMHIQILAVDESHRNAGIGRRLAEASVQLAKERNLAGVLVTCTNHYTSRMFSKIEGFRLVLTVPYDSYLDPDCDKPVFVPPPPHFAATVYHLPL